MASLVFILNLYNLEEIAIDIPTFLLKKIIVSVHTLFVCEHMCIWISEDTFVKSDLFSLYMGSED